MHSLTERIGVSLVSPDLGKARKINENRLFGPRLLIRTFLNKISEMVPCRFHHEAAFFLGIYAII